MEGEQAYVILKKYIQKALSGGGTPVLPDDGYERIMAIIGDPSSLEGKTLVEMLQKIAGENYEIATDEEVREVLDSVFGKSS